MALRVLVPRIPPLFVLCNAVALTTRRNGGYGEPGAGKTSTVAACADAWTTAGYRVLGAAVKGEASRTLATTTGIECETFAWYLAHRPAEAPFRRLHDPRDRKGVNVVGPRLDALMNMATATGASLRLIGDPGKTRRHRGWRHVPRALRATPRHTRADRYHRLQNPHDRAAAQALREGRIDQALDQLAAAGHKPPRVPPLPADVAVAERLHRSTGAMTAGELAHPCRRSGQKRTGRRNLKIAATCDLSKGPTYADQCP